MKARWLLALPFVATLFQHGEMTALDARMAALALQAFAVGLVPLVLVKVSAPAYFARKDTQTPFRIALVAVATNIVLNLATFRWFGHVGLAFATTASACVNVGLLLRGLVWAGYRPGPAVRRTAVRAALGTVAMSLGLVLAVPTDARWLSVSVSERVLWLVPGIVLAAVVYGAVLYAFGERPRDLRHRV